MVRRAERDPKSSVRIAMRAVADENRSFLKDIAMALPYENYRDRCTLQEHEAALYLSLSDTYESVEDEERIRMTRFWPNVELRNTPGLLVEIRASPLYAALKEDVAAMATTLSEEANVEGKEWIKAKRAIARKRIVRTISEGSGRKSLLASMEIVDRDVPKQTRAVGGNTNVVIFTPESAGLIEKALEVTRKKEIKLIGSSSE
jgi:hypothetical protein